MIQFFRIAQVVLISVLLSGQPQPTFASMKGMPTGQELIDLLLSELPNPKQQDPSEEESSDVVIFEGCQPGQFDLNEKKDPIFAQLNLFLKTTTHNHCIASSIYDSVSMNFVQLATFRDVSKWNADDYDLAVFSSLLFLERQEWIELARQFGRPVLLDFIDASFNHQRAKIYAKESGEVFLNYANPFLGKGSHKNVWSRVKIEFNPIDQIKKISLVAELTSRTNRWSEFSQEVDFYETVLKYNQTHPERAIPIPQTEILSLVDRDGFDAETVLIQERMIGDLRDIPELDSNPRTEIEIALSIAHFLEKFHDWGWVHGDLKEGNLLWGEDGLPKVADFGLSYDPKEWIQPLTTSSHQAPEMLNRLQVKRASKAERHQKRDVYSFGVILANRISPASERIDGLFFLLPSLRCQDRAEKKPTDYRKCVAEAARVLHIFWQTKAKQVCTPEVQPCLEEITARSLDPDYRLRPTMKEIRLMLQGETVRQPLKVGPFVF